MLRITIKALDAHDMERELVSFVEFKDIDRITGFEDSVKEGTNNPEYVKILGIKYEWV